MTYLTIFDSDGRRLASYAIDSTMTHEQYDNLVSEGYIEISEDDWNYYVGNKGQGKNGTGYIRGADGKPTDAAPYEPTKEEQLAQLDEQYNSDKTDLLTAYQTALVHGDTETMDSLKADLQALDDQYDEDYERIVGDE
jgi:hypothetical protein